MSNIDYKYNEEKILEEVKSYIDKTYRQHYNSGDIQATEFIIDSDVQDGIGFCKGNVIKYAQRYGKKGESPEDHRKDLMKIIHYALQLLHCHDRKQRLLSGQ